MTMDLHHIYTLAKGQMKRGRVAQKKKITVIKKNKTNDIRIQIFESCREFFSLYFLFH